MTTVEEKVARYRALKAHVAKETEKFVAFTKPFNDECADIENWLLAHLTQEKINSASTNAGTAYKSVIQSPKITDRDTYIDFCMNNWDEFGNAMFQVGMPQSDALKEFVENKKKEIDTAVKNGMDVSKISPFPPGVHVEYVTKVRVRK